MLCDLCQSFAVSVLRQDFSAPWVWHSNGYDQYWQYDHACHDTIKASAADLCQFCRFSLLAHSWGSARLSNAYKHNSQTSRIRLYYPLREPNTTDRAFEFTFLPGGLEESSYGHFMLTRAWGDRMSPGIYHFLPKRVFAPFTAPSSVAQVHLWLRDCENTHDSCKRKADAALPTRVIDVEAFIDDAKVKLIETSGSNGRYLTLSCCWGRGSPYRTTRSNLIANMTAIDLSKLPKTLSEAISYTRLLSFRYLWIDALCIIQDDVDDWGLEASRMCSVYENATLSLSVLDSNGCDGGVLHDMPLAEQLATSHDVVTVGLSRQADLTTHILDASVLETRGWVLQERTLAPAVLHFAADKMFWECGHGTASPDRANIRWRGDRRRGVFRTRPMLRSASNDHALDRWYELAEEYTRRQLHYHSDRFAAIRGLATMFQRSLNDEYVAGLWLKNLHNGLLWNPLQPLERYAQDQYPKPSWTWMTAGKPVSFAVYATIPMAEFMVSPRESRSIPSQLLNLQVRGLYSKGRSEAQGSGLYFAMELDGPVSEMPWKTIDCHLDRELDISSQEDRTSGKREKRASLHVGHIYCLLISRHETAISIAFYFLLLEKVAPKPKRWNWLWPGLSTEMSPCFRRIGTGSTHVRSDLEHLRDQVERMESSVMGRSHSCLSNSRSIRLLLRW